MTGNDLLDAFDELHEPGGADPSGNLFSAQVIDGAAAYRIAKDTSGRPAILISIPSGARDQSLIPVELENLRVRHEMQCKISRSDRQTETDRCSIVQCLSTDVNIHRYFLRVASSLVQSLGRSPTRAAVTQEVGRLIELFSALALPPRKSVQGFWAELFVIAHARQPSVLVDAWHATPEDRYDFSSGAQRVEVKSSGTGERRHHFTLDQLSPPRSARVLVASIFVERAGRGVSLRDLINEIQTAVADDPERMYKIDRIVALTLGAAWANGLTERFDAEAADESLRFYFSDSIPCVNANVPRGVSDVKFISDLSRSNPVTLQELIPEGGIFEAVQPRGRRARS